MRSIQLRRLGRARLHRVHHRRQDKPQKVGNVTVELKGRKREAEVSTCVNLTSEDRLLQKKNRAMNEPIFFYLHGTKIARTRHHKVGKGHHHGIRQHPEGECAAGRFDFPTSGK